MQNAMREASRIVLDGFELGTDAGIVRHPDRYADPRGTVMWNRVMNLIRRQQSGAQNAAA
jgi:DNA polymerase I